jgi:hypothetical protein
MLPELRAELDAFRLFCTVKFFGAQSAPILPVTTDKYVDHIRRAAKMLAAPNTHVQGRHA